jgi:hypothetical protein
VKIKSAICLGLAAAALAALLAPASAQALLPPYEITTSVRSMGLEPITRPVRRGARYVLRAIDGRGVEVTVAADALNGRVLFVRPVGYEQRPANAGRVYAPGYYPDETITPRGNYQRLPRDPAEPSVIYAPRGNASAPVPPARVPSAAKPPAPTVAAKPAAKPPAAPLPENAAAPEQPADSTTGTTPSSPPAETPALAVPPVQSLE